MQVITKVSLITKLEKSNTSFRLATKSMTVDGVNIKIDLSTFGGKNVAHGLLISGTTGDTFNNYGYLMVENGDLQLF